MTENEPQECELEQPIWALVCDDGKIYGTGLTYAAAVAQQAKRGGGTITTAEAATRFKRKEVAADA